MSRAFLETTVLTDYLLKKDGSELAAKAELALHSSISVPQFAWKEFKRGPLKNFVWFHNKLADTQSFLQTLAALQRMSRSPRRYLTATAIQAIHTAFTQLFDGSTLQALGAQYGQAADPDKLQADMLRLELKRVVLKAWKRRKKLFGGPAQPLSCYPDVEIADLNDRLELDPLDCGKHSDCCLKSQLAKRGSDLEAIRKSLPRDDRKETAERHKVLRRIEKHQSRIMSPADCQRFGDAYFVLFCPAGATIITTNVRDIQPMADAIGVPFKRP